jgi:hypothetical protein
MFESVLHQDVKTEYFLTSAGIKHGHIYYGVPGNENPISWAVTAETIVFLVINPYRTMYDGTCCS